MKKYFYSLFAAVALMLAATSCSQEEMIENGTSGNDVEVSFNVDMEGQQASRAIGDGLTVDEVIMAVYDEEGIEIPKLRQTEPVNNLGAVVKVRLVKGQKYQFVFWAQKKDAGHYNLTDMKAIKVVNYTTAANNDETRDAFYKYVGETLVTQSFSQNVTLNRPFAQLNLGTTKEDIEWAKTAGVTITKSAVTVKGAVYTTLNTFDGSVTDEKETTFSLSMIPDAEKEELVIKDTENQFDNDVYYYLSTSYLLAPAAKTMSSKITFTLNSDTEKINELKVFNAPLQRNWRTNIVGEIITGEGTFNIVIDPIFDADRNYPMDGSNLDIWNGKTTTPQLKNGTTNWYLIDEASDLIGLAEMDEAKLAGATFELLKDLSFKNVESRAGDTTPATIKPLFSEGNGATNVTFLGNDHVIRDFVIDGGNNLNSLFGGMVGGSIQNLTVINAVVKGQKTDSGRAAIVVAQTFGNVKLDNVTVKDSYLEGVQKIGGLIGFVHENQVEVSNCTVDGLVLTSLDLGEETGATGGLIGYINTGDNKITNSYVKNSTLNLIQGVNEAKRANSEFIGVIAGTSKTTITNCGVSNNTFSNSITDWTLYNDPFVGGHRDGKATLIVNGKTSVATVTELANALNAGQNVTLGANIAAEKTMHINAAKEVVIDLNGHTISAGDDYQHNNVKGLIRVDGGATVTIKNGTIDASTYDGNISAITVPNGTLIIESGNFYVSDDGNDANDVIMANPESQVIVNGGTFQYKGENGQRWLYTLNRTNSNHPVYTYTVNGGTFYQFIPGTTNPDGWGYEVQLGKDKKVYKNNETTPTTDKTPAAGAWYTVK